METDELSSFPRQSAEYVDESEKYLIKDRNFSRQYAHIYAERLVTIRPKLIETAKRKFGETVCVRQLFELVVNDKCIVIGTLFKHMILKPSILKEISSEHNLPPQPISTRFTDPTDKLILEDELQRITLSGKLDTDTSVTGVIVAVYGYESEDARGKFNVIDYCFPELAVQIPRPTLDEDKYLAIVSGLDIGGRNERMLEMQLMLDLVTGHLGDSGQQETMARIVRVIVAGNCLGVETQDKDTLKQAKYLAKKTEAPSVAAVKTLDDILVQLVATVDVDIMPGDFDPANHILPQQPLHKCMFPRASCYSTLHCVTNPYQCTVSGISILGTSGQPINDIFKYSNTDDSLRILEQTLEWGHIAPTAPDTLGCYPYYDKDPFILGSCPHVYFAANQSEFKSKLCKGLSGQEVLLITVPRFSQKASLILINLRTLECEPVNFDTHLFQCLGT